MANASEANKLRLQFGGHQERSYYFISKLFCILYGCYRQLDL